RRRKRNSRSPSPSADRRMKARSLWRPGQSGDSFSRTSRSIQGGYVMSSHSDAPAGGQRSTPGVEQLEDRLTPSTSSILLPAFYQDLLNRASDAGAATFAAQLDAGVRPAQVAYQIETAAGNEYRFDLVQSYYAR